MASLGVLRAVVSQRIITLLLLIASLLVMALNKITDDDGAQINFTEYMAFRFVLACGAVGILYTLIQIPFAIFNMVKEKRMIRNGFLPEFDFFADLVIGLVLASGVGAGLGLTVEFKRTAFALSDEFNKYLDRAIISTSLLLAAVLFMALLTVISSNRRNSARTGFFK